MIITCPNCETRYLLANSALGEEGRDLRCGNCSHQWFQRIELEDLAAIDDEDLDPIPDSVKPMPEGSAVPALPEDVAPKPWIGMVTGYGAAACFVLLFLGLMIGFKTQISASWQASHIFYAALGFEIKQPGDGLVLDRQRLVAKLGDKNVSITGHILNLRSSAADVPKIVATFRDGDGHDLDSFVIDPEILQLDAEADTEFSAQYSNVSDKAQMVHFAFIAGTRAGDDGKKVTNDDEHKELSKGDHHEANHH